MLERLYSHSEDDAADDEEDEEYEEDDGDEEGNGEEALSSLGVVPLFLLEDFGIAALHYDSNTTQHLAKSREEEVILKICLLCHILHNGIKFCPYLQCYQVSTIVLHVNS